MRLFVTVVALVVLTGCTAQAAPQSTPTAKPPVLVDVEAPAQVFGGDCSAMFSDGALSQIFGQPVTASSWVNPPSPEVLLVEQAGGIQCWWGGANESLLGVVAVPATAVTAPETEECVATEMSPMSCAVDVTANGIRLSGIVTSDADNAASLAKVAAVEALFARAANATAGGASPTPLAGAWHNPTDCAALAASVDWQAAIGATEPLQADDSMGTDVFASVVERDLRGGRVLGWCLLYSPSGGPGLSFWPLGGGAWARDAVLAAEGAKVVEVEGFDLVVESSVNGTLDVFDGVNWIQSRSNEAQAYPALRAIVDALNAQ